MANLLRFMREVRQESGKVTWPARKEVTVTAVVVFIMVTVIAVLLLLADSAIAAGVEFILGMGSK
jgi:preprotein translocase subunit SecE